jgi:hypothetical protein
MSLGFVAAGLLLLELIGFVVYGYWWCLVPIIACALLVIGYLVAEPGDWMPDWLWFRTGGRRDR